MEIQLYDDVPPGSETWWWHEAANAKNSMEVNTVYNVVRPTLTAFFPESGKRNGTAVIICPGGGFHFLAIDHEGTSIARMLIQQGITVFVLKYRLVHITSNNPFDDMLNAPDPKAWDDEALPIIPLAIADGRQAIAFVRQHADQFNIRQDRIGVMGFSAGGMVAASMAFDYHKANRPDFVATVYADMPAERRGVVAPDAPPLYVLCAQDDAFGFATHAVAMYQLWYAAKRPVEMHLFAKGGHGFGAGNSANTTDQWTAGFVRWLTAQGLMM